MKTKTNAEREAWLRIYCAVIEGAWACPVTDDSHNDPDTEPSALADAADYLFAEAAARGCVPAVAKVPKRQLLGEGHRARKVPPMSRTRCPSMSLNVP